MSIDLEFSKFAHTYEHYDIIQEKVALKLLSCLKYRPKRILDLGCGRGALVKKISWDIEHFLGVDFAKRMLELHPKGKRIECIYGDFDNPGLYEELLLYDFDYILSASALQWSRDIDILFAQIKRLNFQDFAFAIFTADTFKTLHKTANITSPLPSKEQILQAAQKHFHFNSYLQDYKLEFADTLEMFRYIKRSGVSGNRNILNYKQIKRLMCEYPVDFLEFEVIFLYS